MIAPVTHPQGVPASTTAEGLYLYPEPLTLARDGEEAGRAQAADRAAYSEMCRTWGRMGGLETLRRYGTPWFSALAARRTGRMSAEALAEQFAQFAGRS